MDAGEGGGICFYLFDDGVVQGCFGGGDRFFADAEVSEPVIQPFTGTKTGSVVILDRGQRDVELEECFHAGFLPAGFGINEQAVHVEDNSIELHRVAKVGRCVDWGKLLGEVLIM